MKRPLGPALDVRRSSCRPSARPRRLRRRWDGVYAREQAELGEKVSRQECGRCHGDDLTGFESAPALTGPSFAATWDGVPLSDLLERMRVSMPQDKPGSLSRMQKTES
jgi:hypothetical protein